MFKSRPALLDQRLELAAPFLARGLLAFEILLQAVDVIDTRADLFQRA
jgi:hypothetical protein